MHARYCIWSVKRSGGHAIVSWLQPMLPGYIYHNNAVPGMQTTYDKTIIGLEDFVPQPDCHGGHSLIVLRDPFNMIASRLQGAREERRPADSALAGDKVMEKAVGCWKEHAVLCLRPADWNTPVIYNTWFTEPEYRRALASGLGLRFTDKGLNTVNSTYYSSFDGYNYQGRAQEMKVLERYKAFKDDEEYRELIRDPELFELTAELLGADCAIIQDIKSNWNLDKYV